MTIRHSPSPCQRSVQCVSPAGLHRMAYTEWGNPRNPRVLICAHTLTRSGRDFDRLAAVLSDEYRVVCPDVVGRGQSDWLSDPALYAMPQYLSDMMTLIARLDVEQLDWFGSSMGGLIGLSLAGMAGSPIRRLVLNDVGPHIEPVALEEIGQYVGQTERYASEQACIDALAAASAQFGPLTAVDWRRINAPIVRQDGDAWVPRCDHRGIAVPFFAATAEAIADAESRLWRAMETFEGPILVVRGAESTLLSRKTVAQMVARGRQVQQVEIEGAGHAPAFQSAEQIAIARRFLTAG